MMNQGAGQPNKGNNPPGQPPNTNVIQPGVSTTPPPQPPAQPPQQVQGPGSLGQINSSSLVDQNNTVAASNQQNQQPRQSYDRLPGHDAWGAPELTEYEVCDRTY